MRAISGFVQCSYGLLRGELTELDAVSTGSLRPVHRCVGPLQNVLWLELSPVPKGGHSNARGQLHPPTAAHDRRLPGDHLEQLGCDPDCIRVARSGKEDGE